MLKQKVERKLEIPSGIEVEVEGDTVKVSGSSGELEKGFNFKGIEISKVEDSIVIRSESARKSQRAAVGTVEAHIRNMFEGVTEGFTSKLKVFYSHFPISVNLRGEKVVIENFIGEERPRTAKIVGDSKVDVQGEEILVSGPSKEDVGQTAANIEQVSQVSNRDPRVFQDGIYIVERP